MKRYFLILTTLLASLFAEAKIVLPALFADGMVLQRGQEVPVWGWADPGETITVQLGKKSVSATADNQGYWRADLPKMKAGGPFVLTIGDRIINDVYVGDVWLCSGQSNIDTNIERVYPQYEQEIDTDSVPMVRLLRVENRAETHKPLTDIPTTGWKKLSKQNAWRFSALGYFLGKRMFKQTGVAQGVIQCSWGGTPIEAWLPLDSMRHFNPRMVAQMQFYQDDQLVASIRQMNRRSDERWQQLLDEADPGVVNNYMAADFDDSRWPEASQYALPVKEMRFCGTYWLRQHIQVDAAHAGKPARLLVGTLYDADITFVNGRQVGRTYYQYPPRRYNVPEGVLLPGDNVVTVRFINKNGRPSFWRDKPYRLIFEDGTTIPLSETWRVNDGIQMPRQPSVPLDIHYMASTLWNGMLYGLAPYAMSGVVWYQGESNADRANEYESLLRCLMPSWRKLFQQPELPFSIVQLANYMAPSEQPQNSGWARLREGQHRAALSDSRAELAVAIDLGEAVDIHPLRKKEVAERCGLCFDRLVFGKKVLLSPELLTVSRQDGTLVLTFDQPLNEGDIKGFELAAADGRFRNVSAQAKGNTVTIGALPADCTLRYAFKDNPIEANLKAAATGLPAVPVERSF